MIVVPDREAQMPFLPMALRGAPTEARIQTASAGPGSQL